MRHSAWLVTILLIAAMFTALACSTSDLGNPPSTVGDSASSTVDSTITNNAVPPEAAPEEAAVEAKPADAKTNEVREPRKPALGPQATA